MRCSECKERCSMYDEKATCASSDFDDLLFNLHSALEREGTIEFTNEQGDIIIIQGEV